MTLFTELLAGIDHGQNGRFQARIPDTWMQGRTTYGGLTAALCHESAAQLAEGRPVRAVQVAFVGPVGGEVIVSPSLLRKGKSSAFVSVDMVTEDGVAARALFAFGQARPSAFAFRDLPMPDVPAPEDTPTPHMPRGQGPAFLSNFHVLRAGGSAPMSGAEKADLRLWLSHADPDVPDGPTSLLALADVPPPAAMSLFTQPAPISSMTWMAEFLTETPTTRGGWWLSRSVAETAQDGYSSQAMYLWNRDGVPVMVGRQTVAIFA